MFLMFLMWILLCSIEATRLKYVQDRTEIHICICLKPFELCIPRGNDRQERFTLYIQVAFLVDPTDVELSILLLQCSPHRRYNFSEINHGMSVHE